MKLSERQEFIDRFYVERGPCCAGCDHWHWINSRVGDCRLTPPVPSSEAASLLGMSGVSLSGESGHILTPRDHHCGQFRDSFDWPSLPPHYLRRIGYSPAGLRALSDSTGDKKP